jgi:hypothetical protein
MRPLPLSIVRLECAFHDTTTYSFEIESLIINNAFRFVNETQILQRITRARFFQDMVTNFGCMLCLKGVGG